MTKATNIQLRGHCQCCGRLQAVNGTMSYHGYTTKNGWFEGTCPGNQFRPIEIDRKICDESAASIRAQAVELRAQAARVEAGEIPADAMTRHGARVREADGKMRAPLVRVLDLPDDYARAEWMRSEVFRLTRRAELGESFADDLIKMADKFHGQPLVEVARAEAPEAIVRGEQRLNERGRVMTVTRVDGARVYWNRDDGFNGGWTGTQAWRRLPKVAA